MTEPGVAERVQGASKPAGEEGAPELLLAVPDAREEAQGLRGRAPSVGAFAVRPVGLGVVILHVAFVRGYELGSAFGLGEMVIGHAPLHVEVGFYVRLPQPAPLDLFLADAEAPIDRPRLYGPEDPPAVGDQGLGRAVPLDSRVQHGEV